MENLVKQRLEEFINFKQISIRQFERSLGFANGYVSNIKCSISNSKLSIILQRYPELNKVWLLTGEGDMLNQDTGKEKSETDQTVEDVASLRKTIDELVRTNAMLARSNETLLAMLSKLSDGEKNSGLA